MDPIICNQIAYAWQKWQKSFPRIVCTRQHGLAMQIPQECFSPIAQNKSDNNTGG